jgi:Ran GTPase-activating protein (RanGAP) involved in mRNA processing and transport
MSVERNAKHVKYMPRAPVSIKLDTRSPLSIKDLPDDVTVRIITESDKPFLFRQAARRFRDMMNEARPPLKYFFSFLSFTRDQRPEEEKNEAVVQNLRQLARVFTLTHVNLRGLSWGRGYTLTEILGPELVQVSMNHMRILPRDLFGPKPNWTNLRSLVLYRSPLTRYDLFCLGRMLPRMSLKSLTLNNMYLNDEIMSQFMPYIRRCRNLEELDLSGNPFVAAPGLGAALSRMRDLTFFGCRSEMTNAGLEQILKGLKNCRKLDFLTVKVASMDDEEDEEVSEFQIQMIHRCVRRLNKLSKTVTRIEIVNLRLFDNALYFEIGRFCDMNYLTLSNCVLTNDGAKALLDKLHQCKSLEYLNLEHNYISDAGLRSVEDLAAAVPALRTVRLDGNDASHDALHELRVSLREYEVDISYDDMSDSEADDEEDVEARDIFYESDTESEESESESENDD